MRGMMLAVLFLGACHGSGPGSGSDEGPAPAPAPVGPPEVPATGATYYVSPSGSDANPGTPAAPWRTPGFGSRQLQPGDTLILLAGTYTLSGYDDDIVTPGSGVASNWIVIRGQAGTRPVLRAGNNLLTAVDLAGARYVKLQNLEITNNAGQPFRDGIQGLGAPVRNVILQDLDIHHLDEFGINIGDAQDVQLWNSTLRYCGFGSIGGPDGTQGGWKNVLISGCTLSYSGHYYQGGPGPSPYARPDGFGIEASAGPIEIRKTLVEHNRGDGLDSKAANTWIHDCVVANNSCDGVKLWGGGSRVVNTLIFGRGDGGTQATPWSAVVIAADQPGTFEFVNVTVDDVVGQNYVMHAQYDSPGVAISLTLRNCLFSSRGPNAPIWLAASASATISNSLFWFPQSSTVLCQGSTAYGSSQLGPTNLYGNPLFAAAGDYHLQSTSPAIDQGSSNCPAQDLDGKSRPQGAAADIGCFEK